MIYLSPFPFERKIIIVQYITFLKYHFGNYKDRASVRYTYYLLSVFYKLGITSILSKRYKSLAFKSQNELVFLRGLSGGGGGYYYLLPN